MFYNLPLSFSYLLIIILGIMVLIILDTGVARESMIDLYLFRKNKKLRVLLEYGLINLTYELLSFFCFLELMFYFFQILGSESHWWVVSCASGLHLFYFKIRKNILIRQKMLFYDQWNIKEQKGYYTSGESAHKGGIEIDVEGKILTFSAGLATEEFQTHLDVSVQSITPDGTLIVHPLSQEIQITDWFEGESLIQKIWKKLKKDFYDPRYA